MRTGTGTICSRAPIDRRSWSRTLAAAVVPATLAIAVLPCSAAEPLSFHRQTLRLPGPPVAIVDSDLDADGDLDLTVVVAFSEYEEIGIDRVEGMVEMITVVPALFERREAHAFLRGEDGTYRSAGAPLPLPISVLSLEAGPADWPLAAVTDDGLARVRPAPGSSASALRLEPVVHAPPFLAGSRSFFPRLRVVHDLDADGTGDVLFPARSGLLVFRSVDGSLEKRAVQRLENLPARHTSARRAYPIPDVRDVDGDGRPDLVVRYGGTDREAIHVLRGDGTGRFVPIRQEPEDCHDESGTGLRWSTPIPAEDPWPGQASDLRDVDGDGVAELVSREQQERGDGFRKEMKDAKRPVHEYRFHRVDPADLRVRAEPFRSVRAEGHVFHDAPEGLAFDAFEDLDGDGLEDLVTVTLDFSLLQAVRVLATKRISIGVDFHVWCQQASGSFERVQGLDLSEKLKFDLNDLSLGRFAQFAGDFDGDGRKDFVHLGRGRKVTIHRGEAACRYPREPDLALELAEEPGSLELIRIRDLDGDGRSDLVHTRPLPQSDDDATAPVALDLYLSGGPR